MAKLMNKAISLVSSLLVASATSQALEVFDTEAAFLARAGEVSTVDFADPAIPTKAYDAFISIDDVRYEISAGRGAKCAQRAEEHCWSIVEERGVGKLLSSAVFAVAMEEWAFGAGDWDVIRFGVNHSVSAFGFYLHGLVSFQPPGFNGWEILVHERDGTATSVTLPFSAKDEGEYRGFVSDTGIWMIDIGSLPGPVSFNWAYEAVSHSPVTEHEGEVFNTVKHADSYKPLPPDKPERLINDNLERRGGLYHDVKAKRPATGVIELPHSGGQMAVRAFLINGRKNGSETHWHPNGQMSFEMFYLDGRKHGRSRGWHEQGERKADILYYHGRIVGSARGWHPNGKEETEIPYRLGRPEGVARHLFPNGQVESEVLYVAGAPEGTSMTWYRSGQKHSEKNFTDGRPNGLFITWYENGQRESEVQYVDGREEGPLVTWHQNGQKSMTQELKGGRRIGRQTQWYEDGQLKAELGFVDDKLHGRTSWYFPDGSLEMEFNFQEGRLHGLGRQWHSNGQLKSEGKFRDGKAVGKHSFWNENGKKLRSRPRDYPKIPNVAG